MVGRVRPEEHTTAPRIDPRNLSSTLPGCYVWDVWPMTQPDGSLASYDGELGWVALSTPDDIEPEARHDLAELRLAFAAPFGRWRDAGALFPRGDGLGSRQWAGSTVHDPATGRLTVFYTAAGRKTQPSSFEQRIVMARGRLRSADGTLAVSDWSPHTEPISPDGVHYRETRGGRQEPGFADAFRDPWYVRDPANGREYLLFTASLAVGSRDYDGCIGIAEAGDPELKRWRLLPPLLHADGVNKELERPHMVIRDGRYYLFLATHHWTFAPGLHAPEGLYGFVADAMLGPYAPLNESGLVVANPPDEPHQAYSWLVMPDGWVSSFADYPGLRGRDLETEARIDPGFKKRTFGGRLAPFIKLRLDGRTTAIVDIRSVSS